MTLGPVRVMEAGVVVRQIVVEVGSMFVCMYVEYRGCIYIELFDPIVQKILL